MKLFSLILFTFIHLVSAGYDEDLVLGKKTIPELEKEKGKEALPFLCEMYFPEKPGELFKLLSSSKYKVRRWATEVLAINEKFKADIEVVIKNTNDPEVLLNCKKALEILGQFNEKFHNRSKPVLAHLIKSEEEFQGKKRFSEIYGKWILETGFELDAYLKNYRPDSKIILSFLQNGTIKEELKNKLIKYIEGTSPGIHKVLLARKLAPSVNLNISDMIEKLDKMNSWSSSVLENSAAEIRERKDFEKNKHIYAWKFIDHEDDKVNAVGFYLIGDDPQGYISEVLKRAEKTKDSYASSSARAIGKFKDFKKLFEPHIDTLLDSKIDSFIDLGLEMIKNDPAPYKKKLQELAVDKRTSKLDEIIVKLLVSDNDIAALKKKFLSEKYDPNGQNYGLKRIAQALKSKDFKADDQVNAYIKTFKTDDKYKQSYILEIITMIKGDPDYAFEIYSNLDGKGYVQKAQENYILENTEHEGLKDFMLNKYLFSYNSQKQYFSKFPGSLSASLERALLEVDEKNYSWKSSNLRKGIIWLRDEGKLKAFYENIREKLNNHQKVFLYYFLLNSGIQVNDSKFLDSLVTLKGEESFYKDLFLLHIILKSPANEIISALESYLSKKDKIYGGQLNFIYALDSEYKHLLPQLISKMNSVERGVKSYAWAFAVNSIDPGNTEAVKMFNDLVKEKNEFYSILSLKSLSQLNLEPELSEDFISQLLLKQNHATWGDGKSANFKMAQKIVAERTDHVLDNSYYNLDNYIEHESEHAQKIVDNVIQRMHRSEGKVDANCAYVLTTSPDLLKSDEMLKLLKETTHKKAFLSLVWAIARMGARAKNCLPVIEEKLAKDEYRSETHLYFAQARLSDKEEDRKSALKKLISFIQDNHQKKELLYDVRKVKLITEFNELRIPFFKNIVESGTYDRYEIEEALWGLVKIEMNEETVNYFKQHLSSSTCNNLIYVACKHYEVMKPLVPELKKWVFISKDKFDKLFELRLKALSKQN